MKLIIKGVGILLLIGLVVVFSAVLWRVLHPNKGTVLLVNNASESIVHATIVVCRQTIEINDIAPTASGQGNYVVKGDSHYDIRVEFQSGRQLHAEQGYVTSGFDFHDKLTVTDEGVELMSSTHE